MPRNATILLIRHAEKPEHGVDLSAEGSHRAHAYASYFQHLKLGNRHVVPAHLIAAADTDNSHRPRLTLGPVAARLGLDIELKHADEDYPALVTHLLSQGKYDNSVVLICWHHGQIMHMAKALGAHHHSLPATARWPAGWPDDTFGWILVLRYDAEGTLVSEETVAMNQQLMYDDRGKDPAHGGHHSG